MISPTTNFAPFYWQDGVGDVIVARADKAPLTVPVMKVITEYLYKMLDVDESTEDARARLEAYHNPGRLRA